jgi:hypothetical protein
VDPAALRRRADTLQQEIGVLAGRFAEAAGPALRGWLEGSVERLVVTQADRFNELKPDAIAALRRGVAAATEKAVREVTERLRDPDLWLQPTVALDRGPAGELEQPNHRVWIALLRAIRTLDPVLTEFGLDQSLVPAFGGGRFGLEPRRLGDLDRNDALGRIWNEYLDLYERLQETLRKIPEEQKAQGREEALRRWREPD